MPILTREELWQQLKRHDLKPVYLLFGAETRSRDLAARTIADHAFAEGEFRDFNETEYRLGTEGTLQSALAAAEQLPMMAGRRVVWITDVRVTAAGRLDTIREDHEVLLTAYLENPSPSSVVIFVADELNGTRKMSKLLRAHAAVIEFAPLDDRELVEWARRKFSEAGASADERTLRHIVALTGNNMSRLENEVQKLATAALPETAVTFDLVDALVPNTRELTNFALTDNLVAKNKTRALTVLKKILDDGAEPLMILGLISYNFRRLLMAKDLMSRGADRREVTNVLKLRTRDQEDFLAAARRSDKRALVRVLERVAETDLAIKSSIGGGGPGGARMQIEILVCELAST